MNYQLTARIQRKMPEFSKGQRLIANYIEEHYDEVAFMTAAKLGATVGVSESTVACHAGNDSQPHDFCTAFGNDREILSQ